MTGGSRGRFRLLLWVRSSCHKRNLGFSRTQSTTRPGVGHDYTRRTEMATTSECLRASSGRRSITAPSRVVAAVAIGGVPTGGWMLRSCSVGDGGAVGDDDGEQVPEGGQAGGLQSRRGHDGGHARESPGRRGIGNDGGRVAEVERAPCRGVNA